MTTGAFPPRPPLSEVFARLRSPRGAAYSEKARAHLAAQGAPLFAIADGARDPALFSLLGEAEEPRRSLYDGYHGRLLEPEAPHLLELRPPGGMLATLTKLGWGEAWALYFTCCRPFPEVRRHLRRLLLARTEEGKTLLFRFYDPRVLRVFLPTCTRRQLGEIFGEIEAFWIESEDPAILIRATHDEGALVMEPIALA